MHMAASIPKQHLTACHLVDIVSKVIVRTKDQFCILWQLVYHLLGIAAGHYHIRQRLHGCRRIDITDDLIAGMLFLVFLQVLSLARVCQ